MAEFLGFNEISQRIPFAAVLDYLNIPYTTKGKELRGEGFIVDTVKNLYFNPKGDDKGSVINFLHARKGGTTHNNAPINMSVKQAATSLIKGGNYNEELLNKVEMAIRAYDPCLLCATHKLDGTFPVKISIIDAHGATLATLVN